MKELIIITLTILISSCATPRKAYMPDYQERPKLESSLFSSDQVILSEDAVKRILDTKVDLPKSAKVALIKYEGNDHRVGSSKYYGYYFWRSEEFLKLQQTFIDTVARKLLSSSSIVEVTPLPSLLLPKDASVPVLREAAVRMQADLLLIFRLTSDIYYDYVLFGKDKAKAYSTCEFVLFDVRTGIIPFTTIVTKERLEKEQKEDANTDDFMKRAEKKAALTALSNSTDELLEFINTLYRIQKKNNNDK
jgi:hypothetical protein